MPKHIWPHNVSPTVGEAALYTRTRRPAAFSPPDWVACPCLCVCVWFAARQPVASNGLIRFVYGFAFRSIFSISLSGGSMQHMHAASPRVLESHTVVTSYRSAEAVKRWSGKAVTERSRQQAGDVAAQRHYSVWRRCGGNFPFHSGDSESPVCVSCVRICGNESNWSECALATYGLDAFANHLCVRHKTQIIWFLQSNGLTRPRSIYSSKTRPGP